MHRTAALLLLAGAAALLVACASHRLRSEAEQAADATLAANVEQLLSNDSRIYARHIVVSAERGVIRLTGIVWSSDDVYEARRIAATTPGVVKVVTELEISVGGRAGSR